MAYKKGGGAAAVAGYGAATRDVTATAKMWEGIESLWGSAQDIGVSVALKKQEADTAWGEYEAGYKKLGGKDFERPKFGEGYFKGPEGEVNIGTGRFKKTYDMEQVRKAGSFLSSDAASILDKTVRDKYLQRTAPGTSIERKDYPKFNIQQPIDQSYEFGEGGGKAPLPLGRSEPIQESEYEGVDPKPRGRAAGQWLRDFRRQYFTLGAGMDSYDKSGELITDEQRWPGGYQPAINTDKEIKGYHGKPYSWLDALYENNKRRKTE